MQFPPFLTRRPARIVLIIMLSVAFAAFSIKCIYKGIKKTDSYVFYRAGKAILQGESLYNVDEWRLYLNPPSFAIFMAPLSSLNIIAFSIVWYFTNVGLLVGSVLLSFYLARGQPWGVSAGMVLLPILMVFRPIESNMTLGQCNLPVVFFTLAGLALFRKGFPFLGGAAIAVAVAIKVTPALFLPYFVYRRQWRMAAAIAGGILLFFFAAPVLVMGYDKGVFELTRWWEVTRSSSLAIGSAAVGYHVPGQSLRSFLMRLLSTSAIARSQEPRYINVANLDVGTIRLLTYGVSAVMLAVLAWNFRGPLTPRNNAVVAAEFALVMLTMTIISPYSRKAHYVSMIFPSVVMVHYLLERGKAVRSEKLPKWIVVATIILVTVPARGVVGRAATYINGVGSVFVAAFLMWVALNVLLFRERTSPLIEEKSFGSP